MLGYENDKRKDKKKHEYVHTFTCTGYGSLPGGNCLTDYMAFHYYFCFLLNIFCIFTTEV